MLNPKKKTKFPCGNFGAVLNPLLNSIIFTVFVDQYRKKLMKIISRSGIDDDSMLRSLLRKETDFAFLSQQITSADDLLKHLPIVINNKYLHKNGYNFGKF